MARTHISVRISEKSDTDLKALAAEYGVPYTLVVRACLAVAFTHFAEVRKVLAQAGRTQ